jgi:penicillin-binding protein 1A
MGSETIKIMNKYLKKFLKKLTSAKGGLYTQSRNHYVTKSGKKIKLNRSIYSKLQAKKDARARKKAAYMASLPKERWKRTLYRLHPKRVAKYWMSPEGRIMGLKVTGIGILATFLVLVGVFAYFRKDLPNLRDISGNNIGGSVRYYDRSGKTLLWEDYDAVKRVPIEDEDIPQNIKDATIALEDKDFFSHGGFDLKGITRAGFNNILKNGNGTQGGSTITQQLVKLTQNWTQERTYTRKVKELILSVELERTYTKQEILAGYLNTAPYGDITYGVEAATRDYFNKPANKLTLDEAAFLAAIPKSPTYYSPYGALYDKPSLIGRQHYVLDLMAEQGKITAKQKEKAKKVNTLKKIKPRKPKYSGITAPWFVLTAKEQLIAERGAETARVGGLKVTTTLNLDLQRKAEESVQNGMAQVRAQGGDTAAFVAEDVKTGQVVALVGGDDFRNETYGQNNYARLKLPPGSSFKPYDYASLIEHTDNFGAGSVLYDSLGPIDGYPCTTGPREGGNCAVNYDFRFPGPLTLRYALAGSRNIPAMKAMLIPGVEKTIKTAKDLMKSPGTPAGEARGDYNCYYDDELTEVAPCYTASAIGDGAFLKLDEHVHGFGTLSRLGKNIPQTYLLKVQDAAEKTIIEWEETEGEQAIRDEAAYIVNDMISDPSASYLSRKPHDYNGWNFGYKTGTTNDSKDGWMMGMSTKYAAGTWVGYHNREVELSGFMENMTQPIVQGWMEAAHEGKEPKDWERPKGIQELPAYVVRTHVGVGSVEPSPSTDLFPSWYNKNPQSKRQTIDIVSNKLATDCTPDRAKKVVGGASASDLSGDPFYGPNGPLDGSRRATTGGGSSVSEKDDVHRCEDAKPNVSLSVPSSCKNSCIITATVRQGTHPISSDKFPGTVELLINGSKVATKNIGGPTTVSFKHNVASGGSKTVTVVVIDSVLYDASASKTVSFSKTSGSNESNNIKLSYSDDGEAYYFNWNPHGPGDKFCVDDSCSPQSPVYKIEKDDVEPGTRFQVQNGSKKSNHYTLGP